MKIDLIQGSKKWLDFRSETGRITATDISSLTNTNPWKSARQLWREKMGIIEKDVENFHMKRGKNLENEARESFSKRIGTTFEPEVHVHPIYSWASASLDGINSNGDTLIEIKCPVKHSESIPEHYRMQIQWQFFVSGATKCYFVSYVQGEILFYEEKRDDSYIDLLFEKAKEFRRMLLDFEEPPATEKDKEDLEQLNDEESINLVFEYDSACRQYEHYKSLKEDLRSKLVEKTNGKDSICCGLKICKIIRKGNINYEKIPELKGLDLSQFRRENIESWRIGR